ncbi:MAG: ferrous iron transport protein B [Bacteroidetes bacterium]|nr:ferrous iron transport protein B [Bacteroidota bacterium]MDA1333758.1 ferrous iron transport protein B [Bacteroidota bacterium]
MADPTSRPTRRIALIGNPNVGKTTVFNLLTGMRQKVGNYPGVTVERKVGRIAGDLTIDLIDLPGSYSLSPKSLDERIAYDVLMGHLPGESAPDMAVCVVDASNLERNLYLVTQVIDVGLPVIVALNMTDAAEEAGLSIDVKALEESLGVPVIPMVASRNDGLGKLKYRMRQEELPEPAERKWSLMPVVAEVIPDLEDALESHLPATSRFIEALQCLTNDTMLESWAKRAPGFHARVLAVREMLEERKAPYRQAEIMGRYNWLSPLVARVVVKEKDPNQQTVSDRIDAVLTHRVFGPLLFGLILLLIFQAVFTWATPVMDGIEAGVIGLGDLVRSGMPPGMFTDLLVDGVITGVGNVVVFFPQILLLFFFLGLMEDTGYMARSAFIMDRIMHRVGLSGGSVVPMLSSFACAIPGIMAARTLANPRDRLITIMVAPLMSCSARLPVYTLFIAAFLPTGAVLGIFTFQGIAMFSMYLLGTVMAFVAAFVLRRFVFTGESSFFAMELPPYRMPRFRQITWRMIDRAKAFVVRAGKIIFGMSILLWVLATFPTSDTPDEMIAQRAAIESQIETRADSLQVAGLSESEAQIEAEIALNGAITTLNARESAYQIERSVIGRMGHAIEPIMRPLGFDWKISAGIISAFAAREVIISALATLYSVGDTDEDSPLLREKLKADRYPDGSPVYTPLVAVSLLVFFVLALQCMSTLAIARRETNSWKWPAVMWLYMTGLAWLFSFVIYQGGKALGLG